MFVLPITWGYYYLILRGRTIGNALNCAYAKPALGHKRCGVVNTIYATPGTVLDPQRTTIERRGPTGMGNLPIRGYAKAPLTERTVVRISAFIR